MGNLVKSLTKVSGWIIIVLIELDVNKNFPDSKLTFCKRGC